MSEERSLYGAPSGGGPAELPEGAEGSGGGGGRPHFPPGGVGGPPEMPPPDQIGSVTALAHEVTRLRARLQSVESQLLSSLIRWPGPGPQELPEGAEGGGGGGVFHWPGGGPGPQELPVFDLANLARAVAHIEGIQARLGQLEARIAALENR